MSPSWTNFTPLLNAKEMPTLSLGVMYTPAPMVILRSLRVWKSRTEV